LRLLDKYILKEFLRFFVITIVSFVALFIIIDFFEKIRMFLSNNASIFQMSSLNAGIINDIPSINIKVYPKLKES
jgi:lipopolysaccharide export system permease protein